jgi:hypothetical protein
MTRDAERSSPPRRPQLQPPPEEVHFVEQPCGCKWAHESGRVVNVCPDHTAGDVADMIASATERK